MGKSRAKHDFAVMVKKFQLAAFFVVLGKDYLKISLELRMVPADRMDFSLCACFKRRGW